VVAREYGLPAVVNTRIATRVFSTGDRIVLDGESGIVRLADNDGPSASSTRVEQPPIALAPPS
jgi:pyruvate,water dikinase